MLWRTDVSKGWGPFLEFISHIADGQKALQRASEGNSEYQGLLNSTIGAAFLGTPFRGSHNAFYSSADLRLAIALSQGVEANGELLKYLLDETTRSGRGELDGVVQRFTQMIVHNNFKFPIVCYYETRTTNFKALVKDLGKLPKGFAKTLDSNGNGVVSFIVRIASNC